MRYSIESNDFLAMDWMEDGWDPDVFALLKKKKKIKCASKQGPGCKKLGSHNYILPRSEKQNRLRKILRWLREVTWSHRESCSSHVGETDVQSITGWLVRVRHSWELLFIF